MIIFLTWNVLQTSAVLSHKKQNIYLHEIRDKQTDVMK